MAIPTWLERETQIEHDGQIGIETNIKKECPYI